MADFDEALQRVVEQVAPDYRHRAQGDVDALRATGVRSWEQLVALLHDGGGDNRARACWVLSRLGDRRALRHLLAALNDPDPQLRAEAARSIGTFDSPRAVPFLARTLRGDPDGDTRLAAAYALGLINGERAIDALLEAVTDVGEAARVRGMAAEALARTARAVPTLIAALADPLVEVRFWAAFALGQTGDPAALPALERLAATDDVVLPGWGTVKQEAAAAIEIIRKGEPT